MTKEKIMEILERAKDQNGDVPMRLVRTAFEKLEPEPHWIPCSERLPEENGEYLVTRECKGIYRYLDIVKKTNTSGIIASDIVAWMPLPEPAKMGKWIDCDILQEVKCSECRMCFRHKAQFCPNCGAKMER